ncbi:hypothetical protein AVEN_242030-1 [Araneus ventricosus]|uniref:Endonuclease/exonuclease/phosphatase domain-containing protein n=1 Tax=Araneus ventricosus TaxID=182803 RepID=A0A4Y2TCQ4_ARAVE|nr:hypothetical protein AVEN_242030-1 [Araneus ventricosus]
MERCISEIYLLLSEFNWPSGYSVSFRTGRKLADLQCKSAANLLQTKIAIWVLADHSICLLNNDENTHFHLPTQTFHSIDLELCTPALLPSLNLTVDGNRHNSDHFPLIITDNRHNSANHYYSPKYVYNAADWQTFSSLADITSDIIDNHTVDEALEHIISIIKTAADACIPLAKGTRQRQYKPWWNDLCQQAYKAQQKAWNIYRRYPTTQPNKI